MLKFVKEYLGHILAVFFVAGYLVLLNVTPGAKAENVVRPKSGPEYAKTVAMILAPSKKSGGSGVILESGKDGSTILTNKHVCEVIESGGTIKTATTEVSVRLYKTYDKHDLCMIKVNEDLGVSTRIASTAPKLYTESTTSGHPQLLPPIASKGLFSNHKEIQIVVGLQPCDGTETDDDLLACFFMGGKPIVKTFKSQVISSLIMAGSSGSAVFDVNGEISGLVFAGSPNGLSYGFIVPYTYVRDFVDNNNRYVWKKVDPRSKRDTAVNKVINMRDYCRVSSMKSCRKFKFYGLWSEE